MSQTSFPNTLIYECSSENASVNIADNEWVNEFSEGLDVKKNINLMLVCGNIKKSTIRMIIH